MPESAEGKTKMNDIQIDGKSFTADEIQALAKAGVLNIGEKHDTFQTTTQAQVPHGFNQGDAWGGSGGLFTRPGADPTVYSAIRSVNGSLMNALIQSGNAVRTTRMVNPEYKILAGVQDIVGSTNELCGDFPTAGLATLCTTRSQFGYFRLGNERINLPQIGERINMADVDYSVVNPPMASPIIPDIVNASNINTYLGLAMMRYAQNATREWCRTLFQGQNGTKAGAFYSEFDGFDQIIKTGYIDLESGDACDAADSVVVNRASEAVTSTTNPIVKQMGSILYKLQRRGEQTFGVRPNIVLAMHPDMFEALTQVWPQQYYTESQVVLTTSADRLNTSGRENVEYRDEMRAQMFLPLRGQRIPVYTDDGIAISDSGGGMESDIYYIPMNVGGSVVTYMEAFDMGNPAISEVGQLLPNGAYRITNGGLYMVTPQQTGSCYSWLFEARPRLVMRTPWLAARLTNVQYTLEQYQDSPYPDGSYYVNGGAYDVVESLPYYSGS